ncbi:hypothetical protein ACM66T_10210 [Sulfurimonas sp. ST-25]|uniref:hypothetical protein n=1 Tax=Sulfurimonas sp. ST-25 TaxID=3400151 RepID=UPI003A8C26BA
MYVELTSKEKLRGKVRDAGDIVDVGGALGERLVLNGHKPSTAAAYAAAAEGAPIISDEEINGLDYKELQQLMKEHDVNADGKSADDYRSALKAFFASKRGG